MLVVDDEPSIRETLRRALVRAGHDVVVAGSGAEALAELADRPVDLLLLDHRMSAMDGTEVYEKAVSLRPELRGKAMLMTGDTLNPALAAFADEHRLRSLSKPFDIDDLVAAVGEQLDEGNDA